MEILSEKTSLILDCYVWNGSIKIYSKFCREARGREQSNLTILQKVTG